MLILRRRQGESLIIYSGDNQIEIVVTEIEKNSIKIGIGASDDIKIFRSEIADKYAPDGVISLPRQ